MADQSGYYDLRQIHELTELSKLTGKEELLIDNGEYTHRISVDTILGYMRSALNSIEGGSGIGGSTSGASTIHIIHKDEPDVPVESRPVGHYYIRVTSTTEAQLASGLPTLIRVSPNMQLRMILD